jgi:phosphoglycerate dehydrogenase-like enzyme
MSLSVHLLRETDSDQLDLLCSLLHPDVTLTAGRELPPSADYDILVTGRPRREQITASPNLRALIVPWAGVPQKTQDLMLDFPEITVHNMHHNATATAEMAVTLMLAASKFILPIDRALREHDWRPRYQPNPAVLLAGKEALILGYGTIGQAVARACRGLGMDVIATRRHPAQSEDTPDEIHPPDALPSLLPRANVLVLCLPHTPETEGLIGARELDLLPPKAVLVNVARGQVVDEAALYHALRDGALYAAGLDVWYNYPQDEADRSETPPSAYPFHELDNVVMSPHRAGAGGSEEIERQRMTHLADLINAAARGETMPNRVDLEAGY